MRLVRRRKRISLGLMIIVFLFLIISNGDIDEKGFIQEVKNFKIWKRSPVKSYAYKEPEPCLGCPGENGSPVFLTV
jgi:hypothetical protein